MNFNAGKIHLVSFDWSNNTGAIDLKKKIEKQLKNISITTTNVRKLTHNHK